MIQSKPSEKGEIITYLSRMGDVLHDILDGDKIVHDKLATPLLKGFVTKLVTKCYDRSRNTSSYICPQRVDIPLPCTNAEPHSSVKHSAWLAIATLYSVPKIRIS